MIPTIVLQQLDVEGFKTFQGDQSWTFSADGARIRGKNGAGKSSIADAILYALFGVTRTRSQRVDDWIAPDASRFRVRVTLTGLDGQPHVITRTRTRKSTTLRVDTHDKAAQSEVDAVVGPLVPFLAAFLPTSWLTTLKPDEARELVLMACPPVDPHSVWAGQHPAPTWDPGDALAGPAALLATCRDTLTTARRRVDDLAAAAEAAKRILGEPLPADPGSAPERPASASLNSSALQTTVEAARNALAQAEDAARGDVETARLETQHHALREAYQTAVQHGPNPIPQALHETLFSAQAAEAAAQRALTHARQEVRDPAVVEAEAAIQSAQAALQRAERHAQSPTTCPECGQLLPAEAASPAHAAAQQTVATAKDRLRQAQTALTTAQSQARQRHADRLKALQTALDDAHRRVESAAAAIQTAEALAREKYQTGLDDLIGQGKAVKAALATRPSINNAAATDHVADCRQRVAEAESALAAAQREQEAATQAALTDWQSAYEAWAQAHAAWDTAVVRQRTASERLASLPAERTAAQAAVDHAATQLHDVERWHTALLAARTAPLTQWLTHTRVQLEELMKTTGEIKPTFALHYDGKPPWVLSTSEGVRLGAELHALVEAGTGIAYPCFIDNAEALDGDLPLAGQVFSAHVVSGAPLTVEARVLAAV